MAEDCIFCSIVDGDVPGRIVYEDEDAVAFLDANPLAPGHTLVVPRDHHETLAEMPPGPGEAVFAAAHYLAPHVVEAVGADGATVAVNDGEAAGQEVPHVHVHVVPRFEDDGGRPIHALFPDRPDLSDAELDDIADDVASRV
ncbi:MAG: HIT family protein [Halobacteriaceae archaeon]